MKIGIIGGGCSALFLALQLKKKDVNFDISIFDLNNVPGKKFLVTGNGRCNLANEKLTLDSYNSSLAYNLVKKYGYKDEVSFLNSIGIETRSLDGLIYPYSLSATDLLEYMVRYLKENKVKFYNGNNVEEYGDQNKLKFIKYMGKAYVFDVIVLATGGISKIKKTKFNIFDIYKKHGYSITPMKPGLTPIKTKEVTKNIENVRVKCNVSLFINNKLAYKETGEVLFKKDGLSGIAIMNCASIINRNKSCKSAFISLDLYPNIGKEDLEKKLKTNNNISKFSCLDGFLNFKVADYVRRYCGVKNLYAFTNSELSKLANGIKDLKFNFLDTYGFDDSQVTIGGISLDNIDNNFKSKLEKNVYIIGEVLDIDGLCGGYNLLFAFASATAVTKCL